MSSLLMIYSSTDGQTKKICERIIDLSDDPHIDYSPASRNYDDEGVVTKKNILIKTLFMVMS